MRDLTFKKYKKIDRNGRRFRCTVGGGGVGYYLKSRKLGWARHEARMGRGKMCIQVFGVETQM